MIITCPKCATRYETPSEAFLPHGRKVKCSSCSHAWQQAPEIGDDVVVVDRDGKIDDIDSAFDRDDPALPGRPAAIRSIEAEAHRLAAASRNAAKRFAVRRAERRHNARGWALLAAAIVVFVFGAYWARVDVVRALPAAAPLYARIGLSVNVRGLEFHDVSFRRDFDNGVPILSISGDVVNVSSQPLRIPRVRFGLMDDVRNEVYRWQMAVSRDPLDPGASIRFSTRLAAPPHNARAIQVRFARDDG